MIARAPGPLPLTEAQDAIWSAQGAEGTNPIFNLGQYIDIRGPLDVEAFRAAITATLSEADALAVRIIDAPGGPQQVIHASARPHVEVIDLTTTNDPVHEAHIQLERDLRTAITLTVDALAREVLFILDRDRYFWYQRIHHLVIDGYGMAMVTARVCDAYTTCLAGRALGSTAFGAFESVLADDAAYRTSDRRERDRRFWLETFEDRPEVVGLSDGPAITSREVRHAAIDANEAAAPLHAIAMRTNVPWPDLLIALVAAYVAHQVDRREVVLGVPSMNRLGTSAARVPAAVTNVLPVRIPVDANASLESFVTATSLRLRKARRHGTYRSERLRHDLALADGMRLYGPIVNVLPFDLVPDLPGATSTLHVLSTGPVDDLAITLRADASDNRLRIELDANPTLYAEKDVVQHAEHLAAFFRSSAAAIATARDD